MKEVPLTRGKVALVDDGDLEEISQFKWYALKSKHTFYAARSLWIPSRSTSRTVLMHRVLTDYKLTDHMDGDGLNNQRENLRDATYSQNNRNMRKRAGVSSRFRGVCKHSQVDRWVASISIDNRTKYIGIYATENDAARAYDAAVLKIDPEFPDLNFPELRSAA